LRKQDGVADTVARTDKHKPCAKERGLGVGFPKLFPPRNEEMGLVNIKKNKVTSKTVVESQLVDLR